METDRFYHRDGSVFTPRRTTKVYLMVDHNTGFYKIGRSKSPLHRERTLQSEKPIIELVAYWDLIPREENALHEFFSAKRVRGEWFALSPDDVEYIVAMYEIE